MAAPVVSGTVALMLQANPNLTPNAVKAILQYTAQVYPGYNELTEGAGFLNTLGAVRLARFYATAQPGQQVPLQRMWSKRIIWGNHLVTGGVLNPLANAFRLGTTWGVAKTDDGDNIVWGTACGDSCGNIVWGTGAQHRLGHGDATTSSGARTRNIVWGTDRNIVWGTDRNIVWGTGATTSSGVQTAAVRTATTSSGARTARATTSCGARASRATTSCGAPTATTSSGGRRRPARPTRIVMSLRR